MSYIIKSKPLDQIDDLTMVVNDYITKGYSPLGGPAIMVDGNTKKIYQALVKSTQSVPPTVSPDTVQISRGGLKSKSRRSYKKYTKKSSSRRYKKNRK